MKRYFDSSRVLLTPRELVCAFSGKEAGQLALPSRAIIVFSEADLRRIDGRLKTTVNQAWTPFRTIRHIVDSNTVITRSSFGGPNIAALVEELSAFGVKEFLLWGYCGAIGNNTEIGHVIVVREALREDGVSCHYMDSNEEFVRSNWFEEWGYVRDEYGFREGAVWSCDAIYRETENKIEQYGQKGLLGVEMETASFYAVCQAKGIKGVAILVVSDMFRKGMWKGGFHTKPFKEGVKRLAGFVVERFVE